MRKNYFLLFILLFLQACTGIDKSEKKSPFPLFKLDADGPRGTEIIPLYDEKLDPKGYKVKIAQNIGESRQESEYGQMCRPLREGDAFSWQFEKLAGTKDFRTPIDLVTIFSNGGILTRQTIMDNRIWVETAGQDMPTLTEVYPQSQTVSYSIFYKDKKIRMHINNTKFTMDGHGNEQDLCIGLYRYELMRWKGVVIPEQSINIINLKEEKENE